MEMRQTPCKRFDQILEVEGSDEEWEEIFEKVKEEDPSAERMKIAGLNIIACNDIDALIFGKLAAGNAKIHKRTLK